MAKNGAKVQNKCELCIENYELFSNFAAELRDY